ncbi:MAG TPA: TlpA disulfide reductase family protein [Flavobacterium sp.]|jgi:peroxiredoxin
MKKTLLLFSTAAVLFACNGVGDDEFVLTGTVKGAPDGKNVILERNNDSLGVVPVDTVKIENGKFRFEGKITEPEMHSIAVQGVQAKSFVIVENGKIHIDINKDSIFANKISGTENNEDLTAFNALGMKLQKKMMDFQTKNQSRLIAAQTTGDAAAMNKLQEEYKVIQNEMEANTYSFVEKHPNSLISALLVQSMLSTREPDVDKVKKYYNSFDPELKKNKVSKNIIKKLNELKVVNVGRKAPDFSAPDTSGKMVSLKQSMGKMTIVDFWASWCGPCRAANPELVKLYNEFHAQGLNIISVSLDKPGEADKWKEAIAKDGLVWTNISNLQHWKDPIAKMYGIESIPSMYLLNEFGVVVAKDLKGEALRAKVSQFLTGK